MRFGIVGCGGMGRVHATTIASLAGRAEVTATVSSRFASARELAREYGATAFPSLEAVLAADVVDAVVVCTPSGRHADAAVAALCAGKHVMIEKPLEASSVAAARVRAAARHSGATATVVSQHRFDPASVAVKRAIDTGRLGRITSGLASVALWRPQEYYDSAVWRRSGVADGGGVLMNQAIHQIDLVVWLMGRPATVSADTATLAHEAIDVEDAAAATIRFDNGALATVHATTAAYPGTSTRVHVHGTRGSAIIERDRLAYLHAAPEAHALPGEGPLARNQAAEVLPDGGDPGSNIVALARQYVDFLDAIDTGRPPVVTLAEAGRTLAVVEAFYDSARTGRPVHVGDSGGMMIRLAEQNPQGAGPSTASAAGAEPGSASSGCAQ
ncbi:MAG: Gfo/Idh/MocA family oxidoreductase [Propionibacterium sp.]|nr:Gfo/Idh/MocA family oxidoreductase [Propionibacterium sp.]